MTKAEYQPYDPAGNKYGELKPKSPSKEEGLSGSPNSTGVDDSMVAQIDTPERSDSQIDSLVALMRRHGLELPPMKENVDGPGGMFTAAREIAGLLTQAREEGRREGRVAEVEHLMQWNGSFIHDCGRRIDGLLHRVVLEERLAELQKEEGERDTRTPIMKPEDIGGW